MNTFVILLVGLVLTSVSAYAEPAYHCEDEANWVSEPTVDSDNVFHGNLTTNCTVTDGYADGLDRLNGYLSAQISSFEDRVGPNPVTLEGLPGITYSGTYMSDPKIDEAVCVVTDDKTRLLYTTVSSKIDGSGNAKYLKQLNIRVDVRPTTTAGNYSLTLTVLMGVSKPWFAPGGDAFRAVAKSIAKKMFTGQPNPPRLG